MYTYSFNKNILDENTQIPAQARSYIVPVHVSTGGQALAPNPALKPFQSSGVECEMTGSSVSSVAVEVNKTGREHRPEST